MATMDHVQAKTRSSVLAFLLFLPGGCSQQRTTGELDPESTTCLQPQCHGLIERIHHGGAELGCATCHGGDPTKKSREGAHVTVAHSFNASVPGAEVLEHASLAELDELDPAVMRFLNPADYRVAMLTCGSTTLRGGDCHDRITRDSMRSTHATLAGQLAGGYYFSGSGPRQALFAPTAISDPFFSGAASTVPELSVLPAKRPPGPAGDEAIADAFFPVLRRDCAGMCHLMRDGPKEAGLYHSSGCGACHLPTEPDTKPLTEDPTQLKYEPGHISRHTLTNLVPDTQCAVCHHFHLSRSLLFMGVRERSGVEGDREIMAELGEDRANYGVGEQPGVVPWQQDNYARFTGKHQLYDKPYPFYIEREAGDDERGTDSTPPSIHHVKDLACIDCHTMAELHGTGAICDSRSCEVGTRCETCHGEPDRVIDPDKTGLVRAGTRQGARADNPRVVYYEPETDLFMQRLKLRQGESRPLTQIARRVDPASPRHNRFTLLGCGLHAGSAEYRAQLLARFEATPPAERAERFPGMPAGGTLPADLGTRRGRLECFSCHNAWTTNCYGCHMVRDDRDTMPDPVGGGEVPYLYKFAMSTVADALALGFNARGRISPMVGTNVFFTHIAADGSRPIDALPLVSVDGYSGDGHVHSPVNHHTVQKRPRPCEACHPRADLPARDKGTEKALRRAVGFGTGDYTFVDGAGRVHLLDRIVRLDYDGDGTFEEPASAGPLPDRVAGAVRAAGTPHEKMIIGGEPAAGPPPGPLDLETINRMLGSPVVPQAFPN